MGNDREAQAGPRHSPCRHCGIRAAQRAGALCRPCHADPAVRALHPPSPHHVGRRRTPPGNNARRVAPPEPTGARPGTEEKLRQLEARAEAGLSLWHPADLTVGTMED